LHGGRFTLLCFTSTTVCVKKRIRFLSVTTLKEGFNEGLYRKKAVPGFPDTALLA